jgi:hypothetical protein
MRSIFTVTDPSTGTLLTLAEAKAALGITDNARDADITRLVSRVSASIFAYCKPRTDGINPPTLLSEGITESYRWGSNIGVIQLSRRRVTEIGSVSEGGAALEDTAYDIDRASGQILRVSGDGYIGWAGTPVVVDYTAGFETVPEDLKLAAEIWLRELWRTDFMTPSALNDPFAKVEEIPGVRRIERWVEGMNTAVTPTMIPPEVESVLCEGNYVEIWVA